MIKIKDPSAGNRPGRDLAWIAAFALLLCIGLAPYYRDGSLILGGEGSYTIDFRAQFHKFGFLWFYSFGTGLQNMAPGSTALNIAILWFFDQVCAMPRLANFILVFLIYFLPFLGMYLSLRHLTRRAEIAFIGAALYILNPFMLSYLTCINQWNVFSVAAMPWVLWTLLKTYRDRLLLFLSCGLMTAAFSFANSNAPLLVIQHVTFFVSCAIAVIHHHGRWSASQWLKTYAWFIAGYILFNFWWILSFFGGGALQIGQSMYSQDFAESWLSNNVRAHAPVLAKMFSLSAMIPFMPEHDFHCFWFNLWLGRPILVIPFAITLWGLFGKAVPDDRMSRRLGLGFFLCALVASVFQKGSTGIFGGLYFWLFRHLPLFYIFKTPVEKFGLLFIFFFTFAFVFSLKRLTTQGWPKKLRLALAAYLIYCSVPVVVGQIIPDYKVGEPYGWVTRSYKEQANFEDARRLIAARPGIDRMLSLPGNNNYQVFLRSREDGRQYTGMDPFMMNTDRSVITADNRIDTLFHEIASPGYPRLCGYYAITTIVMNEDLLPWFGRREVFKPGESRQAIGSCLPTESLGSITIYDNTRQALAHGYAVQEAD